MDFQNSTNSGKELFLGLLQSNDTVLGSTNGARLINPVDNQAWASWIWESPAVFTLLPWGGMGLAGSKKYTEREC